jgi:hypothetical protein
MRQVGDTFIEADHGLADAQDWRVSVLSCGHSVEGVRSSAVAKL